MKYWCAPTPRPDPDNRTPVGAVDTGINPMGTDSEGQALGEPEGVLPSRAQAAAMAEDAGPQKVREPRLA